MNIKTEISKNIFVNISNDEKKDNILVGLNNLKRQLAQENKKFKVHINSSFKIDEEIQYLLEEIEELSNNKIDKFEDVKKENKKNISIQNNYINNDNILYKKAIRSGHIIDFKKINILTENINNGGTLNINNGFTFITKNNNGKIILNKGYILFNKNSNIGVIEVNNINISNKIIEVIKDNKNDFNLLLIGINNNELSIEFI